MADILGLLSGYFFILVKSLQLFRTWVEFIYGSLIPKCPAVTWLHGNVPVFFCSVIETEMSTGWLPWSSLETMKLAPVTTRAVTLTIFRLYEVIPASATCLIRVWVGCLICKVLFECEWDVLFVKSYSSASGMSYLQIWIVWHYCFGKNFS